MNNISSANAGMYDVVISSPYGSVTSSIVNLVVVLPSAISTQPQSQAVVLGANATLTAAATGTQPLSYQWYFDGTPLQGQTDTNLLFNGAAFTNAGAYYVVATNLYGSATSAVAIVTVGVPPSITAQPANQTNLFGSTANFSVAVSGTGPLTYQWQFNGANLPTSVISTVAPGAGLHYPDGVALDAAGNLFIADGGNVIRKIGTNGVITTAAGNGTSGYSGDGGAATNAALNGPSSVALEAFGNLFIADGLRIRKVGTNSIITTVAGNGTGGYSGDGGAATNAGIGSPAGVAVDSSGDLFIAN